MPPGFLTECPKVIAHRGASADAPENTLAAIRLAAGQGARWVEVDVSVSADGIAVIHHDDRLERCTNGHGWLIGRNHDSLSALDAGSWFGPHFEGEPIPSLETLLACATDLEIGLILEIKPLSGWEEPTAMATVQTLRRVWQRSSPLLISSFSLTALQVAQRELPAVPRAYNAMVVPPDWRQRLTIADCIGIHCHYEARLDADTVRAVSAAGKKILCFTVNELDDGRRLLEWGVDGLITDYPGRLIAALGR